MSEKLRGRTNVKWDSSTDEDDDTYESKCSMRLRDSRRNTQQAMVSENETVLEPRKRGRGPSKRPCLNRNALMARENRLRKKAYLEKIETKLSFYQQENKKLVNVIRKQGIDIKRLSGEVAYLRNVLNNNTSITALLKTINEGLRKMSTQKNNLLYPNHTSAYPIEKDNRRKCSCYTNVKESLLNTENNNMFVNNDVSTEESITESQVSESHMSTKKQSACKDFNFYETALSYLYFDHTYTISKNPLVDIKSTPRGKDPINIITSTTDSISEDSYMDNAKDLDNLLPITQTDLSNIKKDNDTIGLDFDQFSTFNMDIFEDLPKCDEIMNSVDGLNDTANLFPDEEIDQSLDNAGICLHVNSDKVSLEFCSICHLNSKSSGSN
nr:MATH and LRR domain-containing protein PFE0570w-like isoform X1 [Megalopta genalis]